jgi:hypothetical protein
VHKLRPHGWNSQRTWQGPSGSAALRPQRISIATHCSSVSWLWVLTGRPPPGRGRCNDPSAPLPNRRMSLRLGVVYGVDGLTVQDGQYKRAFFLTCPTVVIIHDFRLLVEHCPRRGFTMAALIHRISLPPCLFCAGRLLPSAAYQSPIVWLTGSVKLPPRRVASPLLHVVSLAS